MQQAVTSMASGIRTSREVLFPMSNRGNFELQDLRGATYGLLTVVERAPNNEFGTVYWKLRCTCGALVERRANTLRAGKFFTCGRPECRFWEKVNKEGPLLAGMETNCWVWTGALHSGGYGVMKKPGEKLVLRAHVFAYEMAYSTVPTGRFVLHDCDNRSCVRPGHLCLGDHAANMEDMKRRNRHHGYQRKLGEAERAAIRLTYAQGNVSQDALARAYGVVSMTIRRILRETPS